MARVPWVMGTVVVVVRVLLRRGSDGSCVEGSVDGNDGRGRYRSFLWRRCSNYEVASRSVCVARQWLGCGEAPVAVPKVEALVDDDE